MTTSTSTREIFMDAVGEILEDFAFTFAEPEAEPTRDAPDEALHAVTTYSGPRQGAVSLTAPRALCRQLASSILGMRAEDISVHTEEDALKELLNITCGKVTADLYGNDEVFSLTIPAIYRIQQRKWRELSADSMNSRLRVDDQPFLAGLLVAAEN